MLGFFVPDIKIDSIYELTGELLSCLGIKVLDCLSKNMGASVPECGFALFVVKCKKL